MPQKYSREITSNILKVKGLSPWGGRVLKGSLKEALKGAKGASAMSTAGDGISRTTLIYNNETIINQRKRNKRQLSETLISFGRSNYEKLLYGLVLSQSIFMRSVRNPYRQLRTYIFSLRPLRLHEPRLSPNTGR